MQPQMITHSKTILYILLIDMAALLMYNVSGMSVTGVSRGSKGTCHDEQHSYRRASFGL